MTLLSPTKPVKSFLYKQSKFLIFIFLELEDPCANL